VHGTLPTPLLIEQFAAFVIPLHESLDDCPFVMLDGLAANDPIVGAVGGGAFTVTVAVAVTLPPSPVAVNV
jgi:hypothetical protein